MRRIVTTVNDGPEPDAIAAPVRWGYPAEPTGHDHSQEGHGS